MNEFLVVLLGAVVVGVAVIALIRLSRLPTTTHVIEADRTGTYPTERTVTLPVDDVSPDASATRRLVDDAGVRALADPTVETVIVVSRTGRELGRVQRPAPSSPRPFVEVPITVAEPRPPRRHGPSEAPVSTAVHAPPYVHFTEERTQPHTPLADHFELPDRVRRRIDDPDDALAIVRAILEAAGSAIHSDGNVIRCGDHLVVVTRTPLWTSVGLDDLSAAFLKFQRSGARRGVLVTPGTLHVVEVRRREALAPDFLHVGPEGIQRMADAVALGADPLELVVPAA